MNKKEIVQILIDCFARGGKVLICGNGGSASMAQHMAAELICKFEQERKPLPAIALTTNTSILTAWSNDKSFDGVFARQIEALGVKGDVLIILSTSGKSENCRQAFNQAKYQQLEVIEFPGLTSRKDSAATTQEYQLKLMHDIVREVELAFI